jgi:hypothetical protein
VTEKAKGGQKEALKAAYERVEEQEDEHLHHTTGWGRGCGSSRSACLPCCRRRRKSMR